MTTGNEPTDTGASASQPDAGGDETSIVQRPDIPSSSDDTSDATTISQLPVTPAPPQATEIIAKPEQPIAPAAPGYGQPQPPQPQPQQPGYAPTQFAQPPQAAQFGQPQAPQYGAPQPQAPQPQQPAPQFGAPGQAPVPPQPGQPFGQPQGAAPQYGAQSFGTAPMTAPEPQGAAPQYGAPAYGPAGQPQYGAPAYQAPGGDSTLHPSTPNPYAPNPAAAGPDASGKRGKGLLIGIIAGVVVLIAAIALVTAFIWPKWTEKSLSQSAVESGVQKILTQAQPDGYGITDVKDVSCPDGQKVDAGVTFTCSVKVNGENKHVTVTVKDSDGTYEVSRPVN
ncbi:hypothetical protein nbrc107696_33150 [Gordonia spumicola]|uniref:DUF4333 domain-containing protein n=1 Tax=Gordonia spumicola TaxID=589161 RepID=A0A7I9VBX2_9ACTN|nr:DUF4333 domain-containing protein [Gordonia spumicola]GEE02869.1 hypothetical protein nbrc107696_33150 [Gordonia spumicola]